MAMRLFNEFFLIVICNLGLMVDLWIGVDFNPDDPIYHFEQASV
jgi:hypothetical protein